MTTGTTHVSINFCHDDVQFAVYKINVVVSVYLYQCIDINIHVVQRIHLQNVHYTLSILVQATYDKHKVPDSPFTHSWSHIMPKFLPKTDILLPKTL